MSAKVAKAIRKKVASLGGDRRGYRHTKRAWHGIPRKQRGAVLKGFWIDKHKLARELDAKMEAAGGKRVTTKNSQAQ